MIKYDVKVERDGSQVWRKDGKYHCEHGPAYIGINGFMAYMIDGRYHRGDGPAIVYSNGTVNYYLHGEEMTKEEHARRTAKPRAMTHEQIEDALGYPVYIVVNLPEFADYSEIFDGN